MKTLIGIAGCHKNLARANNQRATWVKDVTDQDVRFFAGRPHPNRTPLPDEVWLDCPDSYSERKQKVKAIVRWALDHGYDRLVKIDDDTYVRPERLTSLGEIDYGGFPIRQKFFWGGEFLYERDTVLGAFYVLSRKAMGVLLGPDLHPEVLFEDCWCSMQLIDNGIPLVDLRPRLGYEMYDSVRPPKDFPHQEQPLASNQVVASWEYRAPLEMELAHELFLYSRMEGW